MKVISLFSRFLLRFRYPLSLPEDVTHALGIPSPLFLSFHRLVYLLTSPNCQPTRLKKHMLRKDAEAVFYKADKKEAFHNNTLFSFYFNEGWLEFLLFFDNSSKLRRIYLQHKEIKQERIEISLNPTLYNSSDAQPPTYTQTK